MVIQPLELADLERIMQHPESIREQLEGNMGLCTIMDLLEMAEMSRKGRGAMSIDKFRQAWNELCHDSGAIASGDIHIGALDLDCLEGSLFTYDDQSNVSALWPQIAARGMSPKWAVRFLILRPSERSWWGAEPFSHMESRYMENVDVNP